MLSNAHIGYTNTSLDFKTHDIMKKHFLLLIISVFIGYGCSDYLESPPNASDDHTLNEVVKAYYYADGEKYDLELNTDYVFVSGEDEGVMAPLKLLRNSSINDIKTEEVGAVVTRGVPRERKWAEVKFHEKANYDQYKESLEGLMEINEDIIVSPYFRNSSSEKIGLSNYFYVKLHEEKDSLLLMDIATKTNTKIIGSNAYQPLWYVLSVTPRTGKNSLEMANYIHELDLFQYAEPDFMEDNFMGDNIIYATMNDPYLSLQWGVNSRLTRAWGQYSATGQFIKIAIVDQGILKTHEDLSLHYSSYDSESNTSPSRLLGSHGTLCAGVAAAIGNNNKGIAGVAPNATLIDISNSLYATPLSQMKRADGIMQAVSFGADVISNSWSSGTVHTVINNAITHATTNGRYGKGCVVVFASGNDYASAVSYPSRLTNVLSVGATDNTNNRADFSNYGQYLDVVAPGVDICTTTSSGGYDYASGTSLACPYVAGVAALVLSKNLSLKQDKVRAIIQNSAIKVPGYSFAMTSDFSAYRNNEIGYGLVDPEMAVYMATHATVGHSSIKLFSIDIGDSTLLPGKLQYVKNNRLVSPEYVTDFYLGTSLPVTITPISFKSFYIDNVYVEFNGSDGPFRLSGYSWNVDAGLNGGYSSNTANVNFTATKYLDSYNTLYRMRVDLKKGVLNDNENYHLIVEEPEDIGQAILLP